ncbi:Bifunctional inhibitor/plant lipid transfer protein/seed storage helical domain-containing protein [Artemisia annua]|uniref:Bifunctional inhibitor/plant lipid transfer protein/seed storage helical domain-containing protein n=1 Tax=Artemisia annua TaxID=35608 RepID=A0A2U1KA03_ARTAN|nr:Bifunctional inhibitor/plant lipid transfer protein/seed storage helical domain-containing protein [Artemisia annua]
MLSKCYVLVILVVATFVCGGVGSTDKPLADQCASKLTAVMTCVDFATGKEDTPKQKCCDSVKDMKATNPACICFIIQQIHNGTNPMLQKMKIQESQLLKLPSACKIVNASITDCPKLLKLPSDSADAAIFTNNSTIVPKTTGGMPSSPTTTLPMGSHAHKHNACGLIVGSIMIPLVLSLAMSSTSVFRV